jgi:hypothetical protein
MHSGDCPRGRLTNRGVGEITPPSDAVGSDFHPIDASIQLGQRNANVSGFGHNAGHPHLEVTSASSRSNLA